MWTAGKNASDDPLSMLAENLEMNSMLDIFPSFFPTLTAQVHNAVISNANIHIVLMMTVDGWSRYSTAKRSSWAIFTFLLPCRNYIVRVYLDGRKRIGGVAVGTSSIYTTYKANARYLGVGMLHN